MSKALEGAALLVGAVGMGVAAFLDPALLASPWFDKLWATLIVSGISMEAAAIAGALVRTGGTSVTTRQPASQRQIIYGTQRVGGIMVYESTTGSHHDQYNMIIVLATHEIDSIVNLYLDGRQVHWQVGSAGNTTRNGVNFGGSADHGEYVGPGGSNYGFGSLVYCEARYGDQSPGDVMSSMTANDPNWTTNQHGSPYLGGCAYVYLKIEYHSGTFPSMPEIRFTIRGKNDIRDPRLTPTSPPTPPTLIQRPTLLTNGWAGGAHQAAYEEGVDQGYNWGYDSGTTAGYNTPTLAFDGDNDTSANVLIRHSHKYAGCIWKFAALSGSPPSTLWLNVNSMINPYTSTGRSAGIWFSLDGGTSWTQIYNTPNHSRSWDSVLIPSGQDVSLVQVMAFTDAHDDMAHFVYEIQLADAKQPNTTYNADADRIFTSNWALVVADVIEDATWGLGDTNSVNVPQLIAAANVCDEQIALADGGTETQWTCNFHYDTGTGPGDVLQTMMPAAAGRLSRIGGEWFIWPAYWQGPTFSFSDADLTGGVKWTPFRKQRDLFNRVNGTFTAPNYPFNVAGNLYDSNGWYSGTIQNNYPYAFQPTNYPQYACDALHGYGTDIYLAQDGVQLPKEVAQSCVLSVVQAQRAAKVMLKRNRLQGSGMLSMSLGAWRTQPMDVMLLNFSGNGWTNKQLEITSTKFSVENEESGPVVRFQVGVQEADQSTYEWSTTEEMTVYDVPANPLVGPSYIVAPPTSFTLASNSSTAIVGVDGNVTPQILASWVLSADALVTSYNIQYRQTGATDWISAAPASGLQTFAFITGVISGVGYDVQIQGVRANGATSVWVLGTVTVAAPNSTAHTYSNNPQLVLTNPTSTTIVMAAVAVTFDTLVVNYSTRTFTIPAPSTPTWYYVTIADPTQHGETSATLTATCQTSTALVGVQGNTYIGAILATPTGSGINALAGGWPAPQTVQVGP